MNANVESVIEYIHATGLDNVFRNKQIKNLVDYVFGVPMVDKAEIDVEGGVFRILRDGYSEECRYVQRVELNGKALERNYITHDEVVAGGLLSFKMGTERVCWY